MTLRLALVSGTLAVLFVAATVPALGAKDLSSLQLKVSQTVQQAEAAMQQVLNQFTNDAINATSQDELAGLQARAHSDIDSIHTAASNKLDTYLAAYPDELEDQVELARIQLAQSDAEAHAEIDAIAAQIRPILPPSPPTTTTTTMPPTTTTTVRETTTTMPPTTTTTPPVSTTTTSVAAALPVPPPPGSSQTAAIRPTDAMAPSATFDTTNERAFKFSEAMASDSRMMTGVLVEGMSVVLPPAVATAVLSLPIVIEIVVGTLFDSARSLLAPVLILIGAALIIIWRESKSRTAIAGPTTRGPYPPM